MWSTHHAPVQISLFAEDYARSRIDAGLKVAGAYRPRTETSARHLRVSGAKARGIAKDVFTARIETTVLGHHELSRKARQMQAEVTAALISQAAAKTVSLVRALVFAPLAAAVRRHALSAELNKLDDRLLADIGMHRGSIPSIARGAFPLPTNPIAEKALPLARTHVLEPVIVWLQRRKLASELNALDDRMLTDIGLVRDEIATLVKKAYPLRPAMAAVAASTTVHALPIADTPVTLATPANESARPLAA
jgi:uncharacterized protein YjiS (DUF1127 family)